MIVHLNGIDLFYERRGAHQGPKVLLLHGANAMPFLWQGQLGPLAGSLDLLAPALRGHQGSELRGPYTIEQHADDMAALCRHVGFEGCVVVGSSISSGIAITLAADHPELIRGVMTVGGAAEVVPARRERMLRSIAIVREHGLAPAAEAVPAVILSAQTRARFPALEGFYRMMILANDPAVWIEMTEATLTYDVRAAMRRVRCPVRIVRGAEDRVFDADEHAKLVAGMPHADVRVIPEAGHDPAVEQSARFNEILTEFVGSLQAPRG